MTGTIFDIKRFAVHDGDGIRTTVFLKGCPLRCRWCHNPEGVTMPAQLAYHAHKCAFCGACQKVCPNGAHVVENGEHRFIRENCTACGACVPVCPAEALKLYGKTVAVDELMPTLLEDRDFYEESGGGVTLSGGECLMQADFCQALLKRLKEEGIHTAVDTCGFVPKAALDKVMPYTDIFLYDLKAIDEDVHIRCTERPNGEILQNLLYLDSMGKKVEIRIPIVPGFNDGQLPKIAEFLSRMKNLTRVRLLAYHDFAQSKYEALDMENTMPKTPSPSTEEYKPLFAHLNVPIT